MRVLLVGWFSFEHGEATAGDVGAAEAVSRRLSAAGVAHDTAWSPVFRPGGPSLEEAEPRRYTHMVFVCGPLAGPQVEWLHERFGRCRRIAAGVSVVDPASRAVTGFDAVLARDAPGRPAQPDLATDAPPASPVPLVGVVLADRQREYGSRGRHEEVSIRLTSWLGHRDCARLPLSTRLDSRDWRLFATASQLAAALGRLDLVVTTRLHGMVFALRAGVPVIAVDPVGGGAKVSAQARALDWPAALTVPAPGGAAPDGLEAGLDRHWRWCLSPEGRRRAARHARDRRPGTAGRGGPAALRGLLAELGR